MKTAKHTVLILSLICVIPLLFSCASGRGISASDVRAGMSSDKLYCMLGTYGVYCITGTTETGFCSATKITDPSRSNFRRT